MDCRRYTSLFDHRARSCRTDDRIAPRRHPARPASIPMSPRRRPADTVRSFLHALGPPTPMSKSQFQVLDDHSLVAARLHTGRGQCAHRPSRGRPDASGKARLAASDRREEASPMPRGGRPVNPLVLISRRFVLFVASVLSLVTILVTWHIAASAAQLTATWSDGSSDGPGSPSSGDWGQRAHGVRSRSRTTRRDHIHGLQPR